MKKNKLKNARCIETVSTVKNKATALSPAFKAVLLTTSIATLMGCQSLSSTMTHSDNETGVTQPLTTTQTYANNVSLTANQHHNLFAESESNDADAQSVLLTAIQQHLTTDHVAVSKTRMNETTFITEGSVDSFSSSILRELYARALNMYSDDDSDYDYDSSESYYKEGTYGPAYRTKEDYLETTAESEFSNLYLNYRDEQAGRLPFAGYSTEKQTGMSYAYEEQNYEVLSYSEDVFNCILDYSYYLDDEVVVDPFITEDSAGVKALKSEYEQCLADVRESKASVMNNSQGYQTTYIEKSEQCATTFDKNITDMLAADRAVKEIDYEQYDSVYESYEYCYTEVSLMNELEPVVYTDYETPEYLLRYQTEQLQCYETMEEEQSLAVAQGYSYKNNPLKFTQIYIDAQQCESVAEEQMYDDEAELADDVYRESATAVEVIEEAEASTEAELESVTEYDVEDDGYYESEYEAYDEYEEDSHTSNDIVDAVYEYFDTVKLTPQQIAANNFYTYQYVTLNTLSEYDANNKQLNLVYSYDFVAPTSYQSIQLPVGLDFNESKITLDPSAFMPIVAMVNPEFAMLPEEMNSNTVAFSLPEEISTKVPPDVVFDALVAALSYSLTELDRSNFTKMDIRHDDFAKQIGARSAIKVNFDSKQSGKLLGVIAKHMANTLEDYVDTHPDIYEDHDDIVMALKKWQDFNKEYQTEDASKLLQFIEAISPFSFNQVNYYYLDSQGQLIGKQVQSTVGGDIIGSKMTAIEQTDYRERSFNSHALNALHMATFGLPYQADSPISIDGNARIEEHQTRDDRLSEARYARYSYAYEDGKYENGEYEDECGCEYQDQAAEAEAAENDDDEYQPSIKIVDYGNVTDYDDSDNQ